MRSSYRTFFLLIPCEGLFLIAYLIVTDFTDSNILCIILKLLGCFWFIQTILFIYYAIIGRCLFSYLFPYYCLVTRKTKATLLTFFSDFHYLAWGCLQFCYHGGWFCMRRYFVCLIDFTQVGQDGCWTAWHLASFKSWFFSPIIRVCIKISTLLSPIV